jgi:hypothetical protein
MISLDIVGGRKRFDWKESGSSQFYLSEWDFKMLKSGDMEIRLIGGGYMEV